MTVVDGSGYVVSPSPVSCALPLQATCALPARTGASGGYVQITATQQFQFNPVFGGALALAQAVAATPIFDLTSTTRAYLE